MNVNLNGDIAACSFYDIWIRNEYIFYSFFWPLLLPIWPVVFSRCPLLFIAYHSPFSSFISLFCFCSALLFIIYVLNITKRQQQQQQQRKHLLFCLKKIVKWNKNGKASLEHITFFISTFNRCLYMMSLAIVLFEVFYLFKKIFVWHLKVISGREKMCVFIFLVCKIIFYSICFFSIIAINYCWFPLFIFYFRLLSFIDFQVLRFFLLFFTLFICPF